MCENYKKNGVVLRARGRGAGALGRRGRTLPRRLACRDGGFRRRRSGAFRADQPGRGAVDPAPGEPPLFGGKIPYLGVAIEFGSNHRKLLQRLAAESGDAAPAFTAYIAGQRMTFVKNPLHFSSVLKEGRRRLQFRPVATKIMQQAFDCTTADMDGEAYAGWQKLSPKQWSMLRGKPLLELMSRTQEELVDALCDQKSESGSTDDLYGTVVDLMWRATGRSFFGSLFDDDQVQRSARPTRRLLGTPTMGL